MPDVETGFHEAERLAAAGRWEEAAVVYARVAARCARRGDVASSCRAWEAAGESWRRGDRPAGAARAHQASLALDPTRTAARILLAGALAELGAFADAEAGCRRVLAAQPSAPLRWAAADTAIGALLAQGRVRDAHALLPLLDDADGPSEAARAFRAGQIARHRGELDRARALLQRVIDTLEPVAVAASGVAAAQAELGEVALDDGAAIDALDGFQAAARSQEGTGRRALAWSIEAARVRASVEAGLRPLAPQLDEGLAWAVARSLVPVALSLRLARGVLRAAEDPAAGAADLDAVIEVAVDRAMPLVAGRARFERATRIPMPASRRRVTLEVALAEVATSVPLAARVGRALARTARDDVRS